MHYPGPGLVSSCTVDARRCLPRTDDNRADHRRVTEEIDPLLNAEHQLIDQLLQSIVELCCVVLRCIRTEGLGNNIPPVGQRSFDVERYQLSFHLFEMDDLS